MSSLRELLRRPAKAKFTVRLRLSLGQKQLFLVGHQVGCGTSALLEENLQKGQMPIGH